jgi:VIT1/CCC1 family predicted Fe2+/Mn2+ transporter
MTKPGRGLASLPLDDNGPDDGEHGVVDSTDPEAALAEHEEPHAELGSTGARLNWLRAGVLGANDGIVSTAGVIAGVAGATAEPGPVLTAGVAALVAGALSMAVGEYVSVSTQRDTEAALLAKEKRELRDEPEAELAELTHFYEDKGLDPELAHEVAVQLTAHDALAAHAEVELQIDPEELTSPWHAAFASMGAFVVGALLPLLAVVIAPHAVWAGVLVASVVLALIITGVVSARLGGMSPARQVVRNVSGGLLAMGVTYAIGAFVGKYV